MPQHHYPNSVVERFWKYVDKAGDDECWLWTASKSRGGYGQLNDRHTLLKAHRIAYELARGPIPAGHFACHRCNVPACCNPNHIYAGTPRDNNKDAWDAGRAVLPKNAPAGETHHDAKLTATDVRIIRSSTETGVALSRRFAVSKSTISAIRRGHIWKSVMS